MTQNVRAMYSTALSVLYVARARGRSVWEPSAQRAGLSFYGLRVI